MGKVICACIKSLHLQLNHKDEALQLVGRQVELMKQTLQGEVDIANLYLQKGNQFSYSGMKDCGRLMLKKAYDIQKKSGDEDALLSLCIDLARQNGELHQHENARYYFSQAIELATRLNTKRKFNELAGALNNYAWMLSTSCRRRWT